MNLWRVAIDESSGVTAGEPQPLTAPAAYAADFSLSADGHVALYASLTNTRNIGRVNFDPHSGVVKSAVAAVTTGTRQLGFGSLFDVTPDGRLDAATGSDPEDLYVFATDSGAITQVTKDGVRLVRRICAQESRVGALEMGCGSRQQYWRRHAFREELARACESLGVLVPV